MKKYAFFLTVLLIAALLCGCGASSAPAEDENALHCTISSACPTTSVSPTTDSTCGSSMKTASQWQRPRSRGW